MEFDLLTTSFKVNKNILDLLHGDVPFLYALKTSEKLWFSDVIRGYENRTLQSNRLT